MAEAALARFQFAPVETGAHVQHRQQGQTDAGIGGGRDQGARHRGRVVVWVAVGLVVQVVELADGGVAGFQHFRVELHRHGVQRIGIQPAGEAVHQLAPGPEAVGRIGLVFGQAGHRALEGVRMGVRDAGQREAAGIRFRQQHADAAIGRGLDAGGLPAGGARETVGG